MYIMSLCLLCAETQKEKEAVESNTGMYIYIYNPDHLTELRGPMERGLAPTTESHPLSKVRPWEEAHPVKFFGSLIMTLWGSLVHFFSFFFSWFIALVTITHSRPWVETYFWDKFWLFNTGYQPLNPDYGRRGWCMLPGKKAGHYFSHNYCCNSFM